MKKRNERRLAIVLAMMMIFMNFIITPVMADGDVAINEDNFPDENFRSYVSRKTIDKDENGILSKSELEAVTVIGVQREEISNLKGIEYFTELKKLYCLENKLTELDVKSNTKLTYLECNKNQLTNLDLSKNTELTYINCSKNQLTALDLSNNTKLTYINCSENQLTTLNLGNNTNLITLYCHHNQLTALDLSKSTRLGALYCNNNQLTNLALTNTVNLTTIQCSNNQLTNLALTNTTSLKFLDCQQNQLTTLALTNTTSLITLYCQQNQLTALNLTNNTNLEDLYCDQNQLTTLDLSKNTNLKLVDCDQNQLTTLDLSHNIKLEAFSCDKNQLSELDLTNNTNLEELDCGQNKLTTLDLSKNTELTSIHCSQNKLTTLDLKNNTKLKTLYCAQNQLTDLDLSNNTELTYIFCSMNDLTTLDLENNTKLKDLYCNDNKLTNLDLSHNSEDIRLNGSNQKYDIKVNASTLKFDLQSLPGNFNPSMASDWDGGTVDGNILTINDASTTKVKYIYKVNNGDKKINVTLNVKYGDVVTVTFNKNGKGGDPATIVKTIDKGSKVEKPSNPTDEQFDFDGWYTEAECTNKFDFTQKVNANITLYANWTKKTYKLTASVDGGHGSVDPTNETKNAGETVTLTFAPETGYEIEEVKVNDVVTPVSGNTLVLTMNENKTVVVKFKVTGTTPTPEPPTPTPTPTPTPDPYYPGYDDWYVPYRPYDYYDYYRPHRPHRPSKPAEEKAEEKPIDKPANKIETEVILVIGSNNLDTKINGTDSFKGMDVAPYIKNGRTMLPIRYVAEALGMSVSWDAKTRTVIIQDMFYTVEIPVDTNKIIVNGVEHISDVKPEIKNARTMLPIANIARALGLKDGKDILWDAAKKQVTIIRTISR